MNTIDRLKFIKSAVSEKSDRRPSLEKAYFDANTDRIVATDGSMMHWWSLRADEKKELEIKKGQASSYIDIVIQKPEFSVKMVDLDESGPGWKFPNYERIIPEYGLNEGVDYKLVPGRYKTIEMARFLITLSVPLDIKLLEPFWACKKSEWSVITAFGDVRSRKPVVFRGEDATTGVWGVVMPFSL
jgi:hypothetical protein